MAALIAISAVGASACAGDECCPCAAEATYAADLAAVYELDQSGHTLSSDSGQPNPTSDARTMNLFAIAR